MTEEVRGVVTAWWRVGWWTNAIMAVGIVAAIGRLWASRGICYNEIGHWFFGQEMRVSAATAALKDPPVILNEAD